MSSLSCPDTWAAEEFATADLGDRRREARLPELAAAVARRPHGLITRVFDLASLREAAFRFIESDFFTYVQLVAAAAAAAALRSVREPFVYVPVDSTALSLADKARTKFGPVGAKHLSRGLMAMSVGVL